MVLKIEKNQWQWETLIAITILLVTVMAISTKEANAFEISPLIHSLSPTGTKSESSLIVTNPSDQMMPVEFIIKRLHFDANGQVAEQIVADGDFVLFPPTALIPPGGKQRVRLRFVATSDLAYSRSYFLTTTQVPVMLEGDSREGVEVVLALNSLIHVLPQQPKPALSANLVDLSQLTQGVIARIKLINTGNAFVYLDDFTIELRDGAEHFRLTPSDLTRLGLTNFIPPGSEHVTEVQLPNGSWSKRLGIRVF